VVRLLLAKIGAKDPKYSYKNGDFLIPLANGQRIVVVTKDNSGTVEVGEFTRGINKNLRADDILVTSPSISTGVSVNMVRGLPKLKNRFLILSAMVGTSTADGVQHLERVRGGAQCRTVIFAQQAKLGLVTHEQQLINQELFGSILEIYRANDISVTDQSVYCRNDQANNDLDKIYTALYGYITAKVNLDRNNYADNFRERLCNKGYIVSDLAVESDTSITKEVQKARVEQRQYLKNIDINVDILDDEEEKKLRKKTHHTIEETAMLSKTALAKLLGVTQKSSMDDIMGFENSRIRALEDSMLLALTDRRAIQIELSSIARQNGTPSSTRTLLERRYESLQLLRMIGVIQNPKRLLESDGRIIQGHDLIAIYQYLKDLDIDEDNPGVSRIKSLFGIKMVHTWSDDDVREIGKIITNIFRKIGIFFKRSTIRNPKDMKKTIHVRYVDMDWVGILRIRMAHAINFSKHDWFANDIYVPAELLQLRMDKILNIHSPSKLLSILDNLQGDYKQVMLDFIDTGKFSLAVETNAIISE
jgi:hypothetical protein